MNYSETVGEIESEIQRSWERENIDYVDLDSTETDKCYVLGMFPYPSGNAHMGHILVYSIADAVARLARFKGRSVLNPIGWDAFGMPAENAAIKNKVHPSQWTRINIDNMRGPQIGRAGFSFDLTKELDTSSPEFYKWSQWLFLKLREHGQVYRANSWVNWDPIDQTVLANEQVIDGKGWRSGVPIERRQMEQWSFRITSFAEALWNGLDELPGWSERAIATQRNWIGRSEGCEIEFPVVGETGLAVTVFTTRPDTVYGVTSITLAPEHDFTLKLVTADAKAKVANYVQAAILKTEIDRQADAEKSGVPTGRYALNPLTGEQIPIFVSDYVLVNYGTGAIMNVPAHDQRDFEFAIKQSLDIRTVIQPMIGEAKSDEAFVSDGVMVASAEFNGLPSVEARIKIAEHIENLKVGKRVVRFRLRDWSVSRQRFWGAPIPMLLRQDGTWEPVPVSQLPVILPPNVDFDVAAGKSPLALDESFLRATSPTDGTPCTRETDTMDTFMCSAWYAWRFLDPLNADEPFRQSRATRWMPIDYYVGGLEHANQHLIYFRYISHFLHSIGYTPTKEPVTRFLDNGMIQKNGFKMSKSRGNVVRPDDMMTKYGADALRMYVMSDTPYTRDREWDDSGLAAKHRFLASVWSFYTNVDSSSQLSIERVQPSATDAWSIKLLAELYTLAADTENNIEERQSFHVVVAGIHSFMNVLRAAVPEANDIQRVRVLSFVMQNFLKVIALFCPHLADHLWRNVFIANNCLFIEGWVPVDNDLVLNATSVATVPVQIDGKRRHELSVGKEISDEQLRAMIDGGIPQIDRFVDGRRIARFVVVRTPERGVKLVNIVTDARQP